MPRVFILIAILFLLMTTPLAWGHGGNMHVLGTVTETSADQVVVKTLKGKTVTLQINTNTTFQGNDTATKDARPEIGDRVAAEVSKNGEALIAQGIRFSKPKTHE